MSDVAVPSSGTDGSSTLASLNETERAHWQLTGELPEPAASDPPQPDPAESASASPDDQAVSTETHAPPASEPGTPPKTTPKLAKRHEELDAEIASLNEKLATRAKLRAQLSEDDRPIARPPVPDVMPAASSPAPGDVPLDRLLVSPDLTKPPLNDAEFFAAYPEAGVSQLSRYQARYEFL